MTRGAERASMTMTVVRVSVVVLFVLGSLQPASPVLYGDSQTKGSVSRRHWRSQETNEDADVQGLMVNELYANMKNYIHHLKKHFNHSQGIHTYQVYVACDERQFIVSEAYDGEHARSYDILSDNFIVSMSQMTWTKLQMAGTRVVYSRFAHPQCARTLKRYVQEDKNILMKKVRPRVRVMKRIHPGTGRTQVSCLATGFYPRNINMTLLRNGQPISEQEVTAGEVLPNGDGTYQMRRSLTVSEEERRKGHHYTCTVTHLSMDNNLIVSWGPPSAVKYTATEN